MPAMSQLIDPSVARQFDRLPPHSIEAEMCLLASMMLDKEMVGQVVQIVDREAFYQADHQIIYDVLVKLYEQNRPIDAVILFEELVKRQLLEEVGGTAYIAQILNTRPLGRPWHALCRDRPRKGDAAATDRRQQRHSSRCLRPARAGRHRARQGREADLRDRREKSRRVDGSRWRRSLHEVFEMIENRGQRGSRRPGFFELDDMLNGLQNGEMIIVAARPSMGKTAFAMNIIEHIAADTQTCRARSSRWK